MNATRPTGSLSSMSSVQSRQRQPPVITTARAVKPEKEEGLAGGLTGEEVLGAGDCLEVARVFAALQPGGPALDEDRGQERALPRHLLPSAPSRIAEQVD